VRFPKSPAQKRRGIARAAGLAVLLALILIAGRRYAASKPVPETIYAGKLDVRAADGDSFTIAGRKFRLSGIDAPEYLQPCHDAMGRRWPCGTVSHRALTELLAQPGLVCNTDARDRFGRSLATCQTETTADIAASQVLAGNAVSSEFHGMRAYGDQEDAARKSKRGIWQGRFSAPQEWRKSH
jgi:endonuclease YncB( thermonuclease family)